MNEAEKTVQRFAALKLANEMRSLRRVLKDDIGAGKVDVIDVLEEVPEHCGKLPVFEALRAQPNWGDVKARSLMARAELQPHKTLESLTARQVRVLVDLLEAHRVRYSLGWRERQRNRSAA